MASDPLTNLHNPAKGQSLLEYGLIGMLVAVVSVAAVMGFGGKFQNLLKEVKGDLGGNAQAAQVASATSGGQGAGSENSGSVPAGKMAITLTSGNQITVDSAANDLPKMLTTTGANGTTGILLANIETITRELLQSGEITQAEANSLLELANQGHLMAEAERLIEDAIRNSNGDVEALRNTSIQFNGTTYSVDQLSLQFGFLNESASSSLAERFSDLLGQARSSGALDDPKVNDAITLLSEGILNVGNDLESNVYEVIRGISTMEQMEANAGKFLDERYKSGLSDYAPGTQLPSGTASGITDNNSVVICQTGGDTDSGQNCSKG